jgi:protein gp37
MSDLFPASVPTAFIQQVFDGMVTQTQHRFQVLTKRPERVVEIGSQLMFAPNIWPGVSVESADAALTSCA